MTQKRTWFNSLSKRDFENGAVYDELYVICKEHDRLTAELAECDKWKERVQVRDDHIDALKSENTALKDRIKELENPCKASEWLLPMGFVVVTKDQWFEQVGRLDILAAENAIFSSENDSELKDQNISLVRELEKSRDIGARLGQHTLRLNEQITTLKAEITALRKEVKRLEMSVEFLF
jgi:cell division protein FtsB